MALARLPGGALADRLNRRRLLLVCDFSASVLFAALPAAVLTHHVSLAFVIVVIVGTAKLFDVLFSPAELAAVSHLVAPPPALRRVRAQRGTLLRALPWPDHPGRSALRHRSCGAVRVRRALLPGVLRGDLAIRARTGRPTPPTPSQTIVRDITDGVRHVLADAYLRALLLVAAPLNFAVTGALFTMTITLRQHGTRPA